MAYTNKGNVQKYLGVDIAASFDTQIDEWISAVTAWIDRYCGKSFETTSQARVYDGNGKRRISIDPFVGDPTAVTTLDQEGEVDDTLTAGHANDYLAYPLNDTEKYELVLTPTSSIGVFPKGLRRLSVTAAYGQSTSIPKDVELAATKLVATIVNEGLKGGKLSKVKLGDYDATFQSIDDRCEALGIYQILDMYRDIEL